MCIIRLNHYMYLETIGKYIMTNEKKKLQMHNLNDHKIWLHVYMKELHDKFTARK